MGKITIKYYLNTSTNPIIREDKYYYPIYVQVTANRQTNRIKSQIYRINEALPDYDPNRYIPPIDNATEEGFEQALKDGSSHLGKIIEIEKRVITKLIEFLQVKTNDEFSISRFQNLYGIVSWPFESYLDSSGAGFMIGKLNDNWEEIRDIISWGEATFVKVYEALSSIIPLDKVGKGSFGDQVLKDPKIYLIYQIIMEYRRFIKNQKVSYEDALTINWLDGSIKGIFFEYLEKRRIEIGFKESIKHEVEVGIEGVINSLRIWSKKKF